MKNKYTLCEDCNSSLISYYDFDRSIYVSECSYCGSPKNELATIIRMEDIIEKEKDL